MQTRNELALDRLKRHAAFVRERMSRAIEQAEGENKGLRLIQRRDAYERLVAFEMSNLWGKLEAHAVHQRRLAEGLRPSNKHRKRQEHRRA
jgi:hypothetical protein